MAPRKSKPSAKAKPRARSTKSKVKAAPASKRKSTAKPTGRPSIYSEELADTICLQLALGKSLNAICKAEDMPARSTVIQWLISNDPPEFSIKYREARAIQAEIQADDMLDIADDSINDFIETEDGPRLDKEAVMRAKLRVDTRKWIAERLAPRVYGARSTVDLNHHNLGDMSGDDLDREINALMKKTGGGSAGKKDLLQ